MCRDICLTSGDAATLLTYHSRLLRCVPDHYSDQRAQIAGYVAQDLFRAGVICLEVEDPLTALRFFNAASRPLTEAEQVPQACSAKNSDACHMVMWARRQGGP